MKLAPKLTILFLLLAILPTAIVGYLAYENGRRTIVQETIDHLISINILKSNELKRWIKGGENSIEQLTERPLVRQHVAVLAKHDTPGHAYQNAKASIIEDHLKPRLKWGGFFEVFLMSPQHGIILVSTDKKQEGKYRNTFPYFIEGKSRIFVQGIYYSPELEQAAMTISTPIKDKQGNVLGVLAGHLDLGELSKIVSLQTGKSPTEDTYLVNTFNFFVTEPRFGQGYALKKAVRTEGVEAGLSGKDGVDFYKDYRGVPVIGAYKWLPEFSMCIITEIDQAEAFSPIIHLGWVIAGIASAISIAAGLLGLFFARTITHPVRKLAAGAEEIGEGNLEHRVGTASKDEIGGLSRTFDRMAESLKATMVSRDELAKSEERFRIGATSASDLIWDWDIPSGRLDWFGDIDGILGYQHGEFPRTIDAWVEAIHNDDIPRVNATLERHLKAGEAYYEEYRIKCKDGTYRYWTDRGTAMRDEKGETYRMIGACSDITERKRAEEALRLANAYDRSLIEASLDPLVTIGPDGKITDVNAATEKITGHSREELIGTDFMHYFSEPEKAKAGYQQVFQDGFVHDYALEVRDRDGHLTPVLYNASIYRDEAGQVIGVFAAARDITERKRAEEEVRTLNAELEQRVVQRTAQLEAANKELEAFSYSVSHDLRAPLRAIDGFSRVILEDYVGELDDEGKRVLNIIRSNTQKMGQLIDDLLSFSRLGRQDISPSDIRMAELAKGVFEEIKPPANERNLQFNMKTLPIAHGDRSMMKQVFANLLSNAIKFTRPKEMATIEIGGTNDGVENVYYVKDNGVGFDMQYVNKLFGVFQRLHSAEEFDGTGVGLAIVQRIIHRHGGRVWAEGKVDGGATFYFSLPAI